MRFNKALFLDLDGTIIMTRSGNKFPVDSSDWMFIPKILDKIKFYVDQGFIVCIVTNQGGIELGHTTHEDIIKKLKDITEEMEQAIRIDVNTVYCPSINGYHRKPAPGMAYTLAIKLEIDLNESVMIGNSKSDKTFAENAGIGVFFYVDEFINGIKRTPKVEAV